MEENKTNALINIGQAKVVEKAYDDILSEPSKKAGNALGTILNVGNTILWPIKWINERTRIYFEQNINKYEEKLKNIEEDKIVEVPTEISMPILDRFTYISNEEISNAFVNLLASASSIDTIGLAHPSFIQIIDRLSPDEALILKYLDGINVIPYISVQHNMHFEDPDETKRTSFNYVLFKESNLANDVTLIFPSNISLYLDNLLSLGIIQDRDYYYTALENEFILIEKNNAEKLDSVFANYNRSQLLLAKGVEQGMLELTNYGRLFINACVSTT